MIMLSSRKKRLETRDDEGIEIFSSSIFFLKYFFPRVFFPQVLCNLIFLLITQKLRMIVIMFAMFVMCINGSFVIGYR